MKFCSKCGKELCDEAIVCTNCGCAVENNKSKASADDKVDVGLCVLSALLPIYGIIYWPLKHKETPKKAQACGCTAIVAWIIYMAFFYGVLMNL